MNRTEEEWKAVTELIFRKPDRESVLEEMRQLYAGTRNLMSKVGKYYFFEERTKARVKNGITFHDIATDKETYEKVVERVFRYFSKRIDQNNLYESLSTWIQAQGRLFRQCGIPSQFSFKRAKEIMSKYNVNGNVFDYSCGWGNRLMAALSIGLNYSGVDTNESLVELLKQCARDFNEANNLNLNVDIRAQGSEIPLADMQGKIGLCFSSPPYFDTEIYNGEQTSTNLHSNYEGWVEHYLKPTIENCRGYLVDGGYFIMSIKNLGKHRMYDDAKRICEELGFEFVCDETLKVTHRTGAANQKDKPRRNADEKMMVFRKKKVEGEAPSQGSSKGEEGEVTSNAGVRPSPLITPES